jgi:acetyltransferase-like isoleucine patch superfamily enzyme
VQDRQNDASFTEIMNLIFKNILNRILHKIAYFIPGGGSVRPLLHKMRGVKLGKNIWISQNVYIDELHPEGVTIQDNCTIGLRTAIFTHFYWGPLRPNQTAGKVTIEKDVFVGPYCVILPGVRIGQGSVIKAGTVVTKDVPPFTFWGVPGAEPLGRITVPLTSRNSYDQFVAGLRPIRAGKKVLLPK